jgi:hypothetical protein
LSQVAGAPLGNQNAKNAKIFQQAIKRALARASNATVDAGLDRGCDALVAAFFAGEQWAIKEVADRLDGKPAQAIVGDSEADPIGISLVRRELVRANPDNSDG